MNKTFVAAITLLFITTACGQFHPGSEQTSKIKSVRYEALPVFNTTGKEFSMSSDCSHYSTQITLQVKSENLDLILSTTRSRDTLVLDLNTKFIKRDIETSEGSSQTRHQDIKPSTQGGNDDEYKTTVSELKTNVNKLIEGNRCTPRHEELKEIADYLDSI